MPPQCTGQGYQPITDQAVAQVATPVAGGGRHRVTRHTRAKAPDDAGRRRGQSGHVRPSLVDVLP